MIDIVQQLLYTLPDRTNHFTIQKNKGGPLAACERAQAFCELPVFEGVQRRP